jgi:hypothetical protein
MTLGGLNSRICIYMKELRKSYEKTGKILDFLQLPTPAPVIPPQLPTGTGLLTVYMAVFSLIFTTPDSPIILPNSLLVPVV